MRQALIDRVVGRQHHAAGVIGLVGAARALAQAGFDLAFTQPLQNKIDESLEGTPAPLQVKLFGPDIQVLAEKGAQIKEIMEDVCDNIFNPDP